MKTSDHIWQLEEGLVTSLRPVLFLIVNYMKKTGLKKSGARFFEKLS